MSRANASPFSPRIALGLALFGIVSFVVLLWMVGTGIGDPGPRALGSHAQGKSLNGYAALYQYLGKRGYQVSSVQSRNALKQRGLLILTPLHSADPKELEEVVSGHREFGPTIVVLPKWRAVAAPKKTDKVKEGYVQLVDADTPDWKGFYDEIRLERGALLTGAQPGAWEAQGLSGAMPEPRKVFSGSGETVIPLVLGENTRRPLAAYIADGGDYPALRDMALWADESELNDDLNWQYPVIFVFDADLFNNWGMNRQENALLAEKLIEAGLDGEEGKVVFDLTMVGYGRSPNLLSLAFTPPFLAATVCLLLGIAVALWRAYCRFGPPLLGGRAVAFGKRALVTNSAGLIHRARRLHLLGIPYADAARERLVKALALPARLSHEQAEKAIDRALAGRAPGSPAFSAAAAQMRAARKPTDMLRAARQLHALERTLTR
ncbi:MULTISPECIES: DUF4350 domain-containing protein [unclassified Novosphingobium]|uniref:DUF4350 domain-containing protein n=1 Tax=unclassified Novosphingobium TaxID=2644732 RepID=UPI000ECA7DCF|nr:MULTISPECIES: DUF4350 domain-containing protein [unclassified Novosphingobium]HCF24036.1 hypothetical protein [Novosphingobium sp.]HQV04454.1 DUF4350 domain-containing protein [Novosphingobium sp.]